MKKPSFDSVRKPHIELGFHHCILKSPKHLGRLHFRNSFSQNVLNHSVEVAHLTGLMAIELGVDVTDAKKSGLLHDIGKAINHEMEGSHAIIGADYIRNHGEKDPVANAVAAHHDEVPHTSVYGILVSAADAISASRPGARSESMTTYIQRLQNLEDIGKSFDGCRKMLLQYRQGVKCEWWFRLILSVMSKLSTFHANWLEKLKMNFNTQDRSALL